MKLSIVDGERREPEKGLSGVCIGCGQTMIPKCGSIKIWHWAHKSTFECDHWWENETEWHRAWKNNFPKEFQEIRHIDESTGEWHIADVKTNQNYILEFQHSFLNPEERQSRNKFYGDKLVWIVDGLKRQKDKSQFDLFLKYAVPVKLNSPILKLHSFIEECRLLKEWSECDVPVFFDFSSEFSMWCLLPKSPKNNYYMFEYSRQNFITLHTELLNGNSFFDLTNFFYSTVFAYENPKILSIAKLVQTNIRSQDQRQTLAYPRVNLDSMRWLERQIATQPQQNQYKKHRRFKRL